MIDGLVKVCVDIHQFVAAKSKKFLLELSRHNYVTPTSYLELLGIFGKLLKLQVDETGTQKKRTKTGLNKVNYEFRLVSNFLHASSSC